MGSKQRPCMLVLGVKLKRMYSSVNKVQCSWDSSHVNALLVPFCYAIIIWHQTMFLSRHYSHLPSPALSLNPHAPTRHKLPRYLLRIKEQEFLVFCFITYSALLNHSFLDHSSATNWLTSAHTISKPPCTRPQWSQPQLLVANQIYEGNCTGKKKDPSSSFLFLVM